MSTAWTRPDYVYPVESFLADLDAHGIRYGVIAAASLFGTYNDYSIRAVRAHKRLRATAIVDASVDLYTLEAMKADGIVWRAAAMVLSESAAGHCSAMTFQRIVLSAARSGDAHSSQHRGDRLVEVATR